MTGGSVNQFGLSFTLNAAAAADDDVDVECTNMFDHV